MNSSSKLQASGFKRMRRCWTWSLKLAAWSVTVLVCLGAGPITPPGPEIVARYDVITQRDLFRPERREPPPPPPPPPPLVAPEPPPPPPPQVVLEGIALFPADKIWVALISEPTLTQGKAKDFRQGDILGGWTIAEILTDRIILRQGERSAEVRIKKPTPPTAGGSVQRAPPQAWPPPSSQPPQRPVAPPVQPPAWTPPR